MKTNIRCECSICNAEGEMYECPVCGQLVCAWCFDGEMCDDCRRADNED